MPPPTYEQMNSSAFVENQKAMLMLLPSGAYEILPFDLQGGQNKRYFYEATPEKPVLDLSLFRVRSNSSALDNFPDDTWLAFKADLLNNLAAINPEIAQWMQAQSQLPLEMRSPDYAVTDAILNVFAQSLAWLSFVNNPPDVESIETHNAQYQALPFVALESLIAEGTAIMSSAADFLLTQGHNYPGFDGYINVINQLDSSLQALQDLAIELNSDNPPADIAQQLQGLAASINTLYTQYQNTSLGNDLQILGPTLLSLNLVAASLSLDTASPSLLLALSLANTGLNASDSLTGFIGNAWSTVAAGLTDGILSTFAPQASQGSQQIFDNLVTISLISAACLGTILGNTEISGLPTNDPADSALATQFYTDLALNLLVNTGLLSSLNGAIADTAISNPAANAVAVEVLNLADLIILASAASNGNEGKLQGYLEGLQSPISYALDTISTYVTDALNNGSISGDTAEGIGVYLQEARVAVQQGDYGGFLNAYSGAEELLGVTSENLSNDFNLLANFADLLMFSFTEGTNDQTNTQTGIVQV